MKRLVTLLIAVLMMASVLPVGGLAEGTDSQMTPSGIAYRDIVASIDAYIAEREGGLASCAVSVYAASVPLSVISVHAEEPGTRQDH